MSNVARLIIKGVAPLLALTAANPTPYTSLLVFTTEHEIASSADSGLNFFICLSTRLTSSSSRECGFAVRPTFVRAAASQCHAPKLLCEIHQPSVIMVHQLEADQH